jgi:hypothetical protein
VHERVPRLDLQPILVAQPVAERIGLRQERLRFVLIGTEHAEHVAHARVGHREFLIEEGGELEELDRLVVSKRARAVDAQRVIAIRLQIRRQSRWRRRRRWSDFAEMLSQTPGQQVNLSEKLVGCLDRQGLGLDEMTQRIMQAQIDANGVTELRERPQHDMIEMRAGGDVERLGQIDARVARVS